MQLLDHAKWRSGAIWTAVMLMLVAGWEIGVRKVEPTPEWYVTQLMIWGAAGAGYAILSGWLARRAGAAKAPAVSAKKPPGADAPSRAARRAAERAAMKAERRKR